MPPQNVLQLSASGSVEVHQDLLVLTLGTSRDGKEAGAVQSQLRQALETALQEARRSAEPGKMDVRTGQFSLYPRHGKNGEIVGWQGRAEVLLEGLDFARITATAARMSTMAIAQTGFGLSKAERSRVIEESLRASGLGESHGIVVRHGDVEGRPVHVLRARA